MWEEYPIARRQGGRTSWKRVGGRRCRIGGGKELVRGLLLGVCKPEGGTAWGVECLYLDGGAERVLAGGCGCW